jgi:hypothetical protein
MIGTDREMKMKATTMKHTLTLLAALLLGGGLA